MLTTSLGVASHEGRVLLMTANHPETLDSVLIRPGRVDFQVPFGNANQDQIKILFLRMYADDGPPKSLPPPPHDKESEVPNHNQPLTKSDLITIAEAFAKQVPTGVFSPAEIQGFLLKRKKEPLVALDEIKAWAEGVMEQKRTGKKVLERQ